MLPSAERIEREMATLERGLIGQDERLEGSVALTCCDNYVADLVLGELLGFLGEHPDIELRSLTDSRAYDLGKREADVAIRTLPIGALPPEHLIGRKLVPVTLATYSARESERRFIAFENRKAHESLVEGTAYADWESWGGFSSLELMVQAACHGLGIAILPTYVGDRESELRRMPEPDLRHLANLWLVSHADLRDKPRFRATRDAVTVGLRRRAALFEGRCAAAPLDPEAEPDRAHD